MSREQLLAAFPDPIPVGSAGFIRLVDVMGDDEAVCQAARISYGKGTKSTSEDRGLIRYLMRHRHTTPFEMAEIKLHVQAPMDVWRQWIRHRMASVNEYSTRYSEAIDEVAVTQSDAWRLQSGSNKQGSGGMLTEWPGGGASRMSPGAYLTEHEADLHEHARAVYRDRLKLGVAREQARKDLPLSTYTAAYWKIDLHNLLHFLQLRLDPHAQLEIRQFAEAIARVVESWVPWTWEAFVDYRLEAVMFSRQEMAVLRGVVRGLVFSEQVRAAGARNWPQERVFSERDFWRDLFPADLTQRERKAFLAALGRLEGLDDDATVPDGSTP